MAGKQRGLTVPRVMAWRLERALTQQELADLAHVSRNTVARAERGEPLAVANVRKLAGALGITVSQLLHQEPGESKVRGAA